ncbi:MAG: hypothetical protein EBU75_12400 [Betaproteobacteria bacterium]|jgi:hypothetical protein|nr:hypothetical protein [Betaproteobacteria bacterium]
MATRGVMGASVSEKKMHYPVMTERQLASRWKISLNVLSYVETSTWDKDIREPFPGFLFRVGHGSERKVLAPGFAKYFGTS